MADNCWVLFWSFPGPEVIITYHLMVSQTETLLKRPLLTLVSRRDHYILLYGELYMNFAEVFADLNI